MGLPKAGSGYQTTDGNRTSPVLTLRTISNIAGAASIIAVATLATGFLVLAPGGGAGTMTLPTAGKLDEYFGDSVSGHSFDVDVLNTDAGAVTITPVDGGGITLIGKATIAQNERCLMRFVKTAKGVWTVYRL